MQAFNIQTSLRNSQATLLTSNPAGRSDSPSSRMQLKGGYMMKLLTASFILSSIVSVEGMEHGIAPFGNGRANALVPHLNMRSLGGTHSCSALRLNRRQVLTAKHCVATTSNLNIHMPTYKGGKQSASKVVKHPREDVAIVTFPEDLPGPRVCPPQVMKKPSYKRWLKNEKAGIHGCGIATNTLVAGRGLKSNNPKAPYGDLTTGSFKLEKEIHANHRLILKGTSENTPEAVLQGDSGGPVFSCNGKTGEFELTGVVSGIMGQNEGSIHSNIANHRDYYEAETQNLRPWLRQNTTPCLDEPVSAFELYPNKGHLESNFPKTKHCVDVKINFPNSTSLSVDIVNQCPKNTVTEISIDLGSSKKQITTRVHKNQSSHLLLEMDGGDIQVDVSSQYSQKK